MVWLSGPSVQQLLASITGWDCRPSSIASVSPRGADCGAQQNEGVNVAITSTTTGTARHGSLSLLILAASVLAAAAVYWWEAEADRAQRQCEMYVGAVRTSDVPAMRLIEAVYAKDGQVLPMARTLAAMLNMQPADQQFCYYPPYDPDWLQKRGE
jgi:hypothetical protein